MDSEQERVVHDIEGREQLDILLYLGQEEFLFARAEFEVHVPSDPIQIFERPARILLELFLVEFSSNGRALKIIVK